MMLIHRGLDGFVSFHRKRNEEWQNLASIPAANIPTMLPQIASELEQDSYFSINGFYRAGWGTGPLGLPSAYRKEKDARYLNGCFIDLDVHIDRQPFEIGRLVGMVISAQDRKLFPPASMFCRSGRGLWLLWLLHQGQNLKLPPPAFPEQKRIYIAIQAELIRRVRNELAKYGFPDYVTVDGAVKDVVRVMRVPGSRNSKVFPGDPQRVQFWPQLNNIGEPYSYTLPTLTDLLDIAIPAFHSSRRAKLVGGNGDSGKGGWQALWRQRHQDFAALRGMRGTFRKGCRNNAAYVYGIILRGEGLSDTAVADAVMRFGHECTPPLTQAEIQGAIIQSRESRRRVSDPWIAAVLKVTPEEASQIPRWATKEACPTVWFIDLHLSSKERTKLRKKVMLEIVQSLDGRLPSSRQMVRLLQQRGICISHVQVQHDYKRLEIPTLETTFR
jgi:hypothetical protein